MILSCPECGTAFNIELLAINQGRKVRCGVCSNIWFASPNQLKSEPIREFPTIKKTMQPPKEIPQIPIQNKLEPEKNTKPKPLVSKEIDRSSEFSKKKKVNNFTGFFASLINWIAFWSVLSLLIFFSAGFWGKNIIVGFYPETLKIYKLLNIKIIPRISNLEVVDLKAENKGDIIKITGKIFNKSFLPSISPIISVVTLNKEGEIIENFDIEAEQKVIKAQKFNFFNTEIYVPEDRNSKTTEIRANLIKETPE